MTKRLFSRDELMNAPRLAIARVCVKAFSSIDHLRKEHQLLGLACAFILLCEACKLPAQDVFTAAKNLMVNPDKEASARPLAPQFEAMQYHLRTELLSEGE